MKLSAELLRLLALLAIVALALAQHLWVCPVGGTQKVNGASVAFGRGDRAPRFLLGSVVSYDLRSLFNSLDVSAIAGRASSAQCCGADLLAGRKREDGARRNKGSG